MPQRESKKPRVVSPYKYQSVAECEENEDFHIARPTSWPPRRTGNMTGDPYLSTQCILCAGWLIVYKAHATGEMNGIKVDLSLVPNRKSA